tara:strand:- start:55498 stop:56505 length:1008 start_codon:yes stop_codon:yes gene_type:complete
MNNTYFTKEQPPSGRRGIGDQGLDEPIPRFLNRSEDKMWFGANNTLIWMGRDRDPQEEGSLSSSPTTSDLSSGFSTYQGAGAICLVVGRGAPYPVVDGKGSKPQGQAPMFKDGPEPSYGGVELYEGKHDTWACDAATLYISQKSDVDKSFGFKEMISGKGQKIKYERRPSSAIVLKADKVRINSRRDIYLIAGSEFGRDSNGFNIKETEGAIHLVSKHDGVFREQQPIPLGTNLVQFLKSFLNTTAGAIATINKILISQAEFNSQVMYHHHGTGVGPTTFSPPVAAAGLKKCADDITSLENTIFDEFINIPFSLDNGYLDKSSNKYINSLSNTTN